MVASDEFLKTQKAKFDVLQNEFIKLRTRTSGYNYQVSKLENKDLYNEIIQFIAKIEALKLENDRQILARNRKKDEIGMAQLQALNLELRKLKKYSERLRVE